MRLPSASRAVQGERAILWGTQQILFSVSPECRTGVKFCLPGAFVGASSYASSERILLSRPRRLLCCGPLPMQVPSIACFPSFSWPPLLRPTPYASSEYFCCPGLSWSPLPRPTPYASSEHLVLSWPLLASSAPAHSVCKLRAFIASQASLGVCCGPLPMQVPSIACFPSSPGVLCCDPLRMQVPSIACFPGPSWPSVPRPTPYASSGHVLLLWPLLFSSAATHSVCKLRASSALVASSGFHCSCLRTAENGLQTVQGRVRTEIGQSWPYFGKARQRF